MSFNFEIDFESEEVNVFVDQKLIAAFYRTEQGDVVAKRIRTEFSDEENTLANIARMLMDLAEVS